MVCAMEEAYSLEYKGLGEFFTAAVAINPSSSTNVALYLSS